MKIFIPARIFLITVIVSLLFYGHPATAGERGLHLSSGIMFLTNSSQQGGTGPSGSTLLTQTELNYHWGWWGLGAYFQYDKQGSNETDTATGPKLELHFGAFYFEGGYSFMMARAYTDRSISKQTGNGWLVGAGVRVPLQGAAGQASKGAFLQFSYKFRTQTIQKQDGNLLSDPIIQKDGYPLFGIGYLF